MTGAQYLAILRRNLANSFDFFEPASFQSLKVDLYASLNLTNESYFISRRIPLYAVKHNEYVLGIIISEVLTKEKAAQLCDDIKNSLSEIVNVDSEHMSSCVTLAFFCEQEIPVETQQVIQKFKYHKDFMFTLRGWADMAVIGVDLTNNIVWNNKFGKKICENYRKILSAGLTG